MDGERTERARTGGRFGRIGLALLLVIMTSVGPLAPTPPVAHAASFTVTTTTDAPHSSPLNGSCTSTLPGNPCTLRAAVQAANFLGGGPHTIALSAGTYTFTIAGFENASAAGDLDVISGVTVSIVGAGAASTIVQAGPTPDSGIDRVFAVNQDAALSVSDVTVRHGKVVGDGAGIITEFGSTLELNRVVVTANHAVRAGNVCGHGGGIKTRGPVSIADSTISGNTADCAGGGIRNDWSTTLTNVTISGNVAGFGGGGIDSSDGHVTLRNISVVGNTSRNSNSGVGGVTVAADGTTVRNSIIANNSGASGRANCQGPTDFVSEGYNLSNTGECPFTATGDLRNTDPKLGPLQNNGGPSPTHALLPDSPAVDAGNPATPGGADPNACPSADQRAVSRPQDGGNNRCDIGAVELPRFQVASPADAVDAKIGDLRCAAAGGACTLRAAIQESNALGGALIVLPSATYNLAIPGTGEDAAVSGDLDITQSLTLQTKGATIDGGNIDRVFDVRNGAQVVMGLLTIQGGAAPAGQSGGGVRVSGTNSRLTLSESTVRGSTAAGGAGIAHEGGTLDLTNVTLSGNRATTTGGGLLTSAGQSSLTNVTIANNAAIVSGGGVFRSGGSLDLKSSLLSGNGPTNCAGAITSRGTNLDSANSCNFNATPNDGDLINADARLGPLQDNGGASPTHALLAGSAAIDAGPTTGCPTRDQRLQPRPRDGNGDGSVRCDIGAVEVQPNGGGGGGAGAFSVQASPPQARPGQPVVLSFTWTVPAPQVWRDLDRLDLRLLGANGQPVFILRWTEAGDRYVLLDASGRELGAGTPGSATVLSTPLVSLGLRDVKTQGSGPTGQGVTLVLPLVFSQAADDQAFTVQVAGRTDAGAEDPFAVAATIQVGDPAGPAPPQAPNDDGKDEKPERPRQETEEQRQQRERSNAAGQDEYRIEGNVVEAHLDERPPYLVIGTRDGPVRLTLRGDAARVTVNIGDYVTAEGEKVHEQLYLIDDLDVE